MRPSPTQTLLLCTTLAAACGSSTLGGNGGPCDEANPPPECTEACSDDVPCPAGFYCGSDGRCTADCTAGGDECPDGERCDEDGRCVPDDRIDTDANNCPNVAVRVSAIIPTVLLLIDQSGSMDESFASGTRWEAMREALVDPDQGVVTLLAARVIFGATLYSSQHGNEGGTCPMLEEVAPAINNFAAIQSLINDNEPLSDTPTSEAIDAAVATFPQPDPDNPTPSILVLATDGNPDNCVDPDAHDESSQQMSEASVQAAYRAGLVTYILSVGDEVALPHLQKLANAGVGEPLDTGTARFYVALNPEELITAFHEIIGGARTCTFTLENAVTLAEAPQGTVELNGTPLDYGTDWTMINETTLELLGDACTAFLNAADAVLTAEFPCGVVVD